MKSFSNTIIILILSFLSISAFGQNNNSTVILSPDQKIAVQFELIHEHAVYSVSYSDTVIIQRSALGLICDDEDFSQKLSLIKIDPTQEVQDNYTLIYGKKLNCSYQANRQVVHLKSATGKLLDVIFQVSNDGIAFRYFFPETIGNRKVNSEVTAFNLATESKAWIQPNAEAKSGWESTQPSYEKYYLQDVLVNQLPENKAGWIYPALFNLKNSWILISETASYRDYCATRLLHTTGTNNFTVGFPDAREIFPGGGSNPESALLWYTPWRFIAISKSLDGIVESTLGTDLAKPASTMIDYSWVKPGRASWSWAILKDDSTVYRVQKRFVDYAADMKWEYCLVDALWEKQIGEVKMAELSAYAQTKNVGLLLWYNSAGDWNTTYQGPKNRLLTEESRQREFGWLQKIGVNGIKVDFFGGDGQSMMTYYLDILEDAAKYKLMVNFHGCTLPRGWQRTYPNLVSMESVRGFENVTFKQADADLQANQCCMVPFTRNVFDPMDYTPMCFSEIPKIIRRTSNAFELALPFIFHSGITHFAEIPEGIANSPEYVRNLLTTIPVSWDETRLLDGYPGKYVIMASRKGETWYISGINATGTNKEVTFELPFVKADNGMLITDGDNNRSFIQESIKLNASRTVTFNLKPNGGFVLKL